MSRKDSKKLKSDAKTRRKSDVTPIEDSSSSAKLDKKRRKLKERAERLEQEGLALLAQAKEAAEAYDRLTLKVRTACRRSAWKCSFHSGCSISLPGYYCRLLTPFVF